MFAARTQLTISLSSLATVILPSVLLTPDHAFILDTYTCQIVGLSRTTVRGPIPARPQLWLSSHTTRVLQHTSRAPQHTPPATAITALTRTNHQPQYLVAIPAAAPTPPAAPAVPIARTHESPHRPLAQARARGMRPGKRRTTTSTTKMCAKSGIARL